MLIVKATLFQQTKGDKMEFIIKTRNLTKKYGQEISVNNVNLNIPKGSVYGFLGPNGAGKTTTMKMILGLVHKTTGSIEILGEQITDKNRLKYLATIGSLIETPSYYSHLTARENLEVTCVLKNIPKTQIASVLKIVNLENTGNKQVSKFSLGMKQRLAIANALLGKPPILLLDEPTNGRDPAGIYEIRDLIQNLPNIMDTTVLISSHLLSEIEQIAQHVSIIKKGNVVFEGTLENLKEKSNAHLKIQTNNNKKAVEILPKLNIQNGEIIIPVVNDETIINMQKKLFEKDVYITRISENSKSLEQIFLEITA